MLFCLRFLILLFAAGIVKTRLGGFPSRAAALTVTAVQSTGIMPLLEPSKTKNNLKKLLCSTNNCRTHSSTGWKAESHGSFVNKNELWSKNTPDTPTEVKCPIPNLTFHIHPFNPN